MGLGSLAQVPAVLPLIGTDLPLRGRWTSTFHLPPLYYIFRLSLSVISCTLPNSPFATRSLCTALVSFLSVLLDFSPNLSVPRTDFVVSGCLSRLVCTYMCMPKHRLVQRNTIQIVTSRNGYNAKNMCGYRLSVFPPFRFPENRCFGCTHDA